MIHVSLSSRESLCGTSAQREVQLVRHCCASSRWGLADWGAVNNKLLCGDAERRGGSTESHVGRFIT